MARKAVRPLTRSARADPRIRTGVVLASSLQDHRVGVGRPWSAVQTRAWPSGRFVLLVVVQNPGRHVWLGDR
jgi:hypothetical protein